MKNTESRLNPPVSTAGAIVALSKYSLLALMMVAAPGCGPASHAATLRDLRARAQGGDPDAAWAWAEAELLGPDATSTEADAATQLAVERRADDSRVHLLRAGERNLHGALNEAFSANLRAARLASESTAPASADVAEVAMLQIQELQDGVADFEDRVLSLEDIYLQPTAGFGPAAHHILGQLLIDIYLRRGSLTDAERIRNGSGCASTLQVAGPFGPQVLAGLDTRYAPEADAQLGANYDLGGLRGSRATRTLDTLTCTHHLGGGPVPSNGTFYVEHQINVTSAGSYVVRIETPNTYRLLVDGQEQATVDRRHAILARVQLHEVNLSNGSHTVRVKLSSAHPSPVLVLSVTDRAGRALGSAVPGEAGTYTPDAMLSGRTLETKSLWERYLWAVRDLGRSHPIAVRENLRTLPGLGDAGAKPSALMATYYAAALLSDPVLNRTTTADSARDVLTRVQANDDNVWYAPLQLARMDADNGQRATGLANLRALRTRFPEVFAIAIFVREQEQALGLNERAAASLVSLQQAFPFSCRAIRMALDEARERVQAEEEARLVEALMGCDARNDARLSLLLRQRKTADARAELERLLRFEPPSHATQVANARLTLARAENADVDALLRTLHEAMPRNEAPVLMLSDRTLAAGRAAESEQTLTDALRAESDLRGTLQRPLRAVFGVDPLASFRKNGLEVLAQYRASNATYRQPKVLVLDYAAMRVFADGSVLQLVHQITKVQTEEAADEEGQYSAPEGAEILTLRTIKADGTTIEPDHIQGLDHVEMPSLQPGDFVEHEYLLFVPASERGLTSPFRFYFASYETPFVLSELKVITPTAMQPTWVRRGPAPEDSVSTARDGNEALTVHTFTAHDVAAYVPEQGSVAMREFFPSIYWGVGSTWDGFIDTLAEALLDKDLPDPSLTRTLNEIIARVDRSERARAQALYAWVHENIEPGNNAFGQVATMVSGRTGHPLRILHHFLRALNIASDIVVVRGHSEDQLPQDVPDEGTYTNLLLRTRLDGQDVWLSAGNRGVPFGYVPPLLRGADGFVLSTGHEGRQVRVPELPDQDRREVMVSVEVNGAAADFSVTETFTGLGAGAWREQLRNIPAAELERRFGDVYVARLVPGAVAQSVTIEHRDEAEQPLTFRYRFHVDNWGRMGRNGRVAALPFGAGAAESLAAADSRTTPLNLVLPIALDVTVRIQGAALDRVTAAETSVRAEHATFTFRRGREDDTLVVTRSLRVPRARVAPSAYPEFANFCHQVDEFDMQEVPLR